MRRAILPGASVVLTNNHSPTVVVNCFEAGALGYVLKNEQIANNPRYLIRTVLSGGSPISPVAAKFLVESFRSRKPASENPITRMKQTQEKNPLSPREREILQLSCKRHAFFGNIRSTVYLQPHGDSPHQKDLQKASGSFQRRGCL